VDYAVGLSEIAPVGARVGPDRPLAVIHARDAAAAQEAERALLAAVHVDGEQPSAGPVVAGRVG
jgi:thymidine phosphorylase